MNNSEVQREIDECWRELNHVKSLIDGLGPTSNITPFLTKYTIIRACGSIEYSFKSIIADHCERRSKKQVKRFISRRVREGSANPSYDMICKFLHDFDSDWKKEFKKRINDEPNKTYLLTSLQSLVDARNDFAHGGNPSASISDIIDYFRHAKRIIEILDEIVG